MIETELEERIAIIQRTRSIAALALVDALSHSHEASSERAICNRWTQTIDKSPSLCPEGWYQPPPGGACILIGHPENAFARMNYDSLRNPAIWPRDDISLRDDSLIYAYASPIDRATGLIGDIGLTLYRGPEPWIRDHLLTCLEVTTRVASFAEVGMELRELFNYAQREIEAAELSNETSSTASGIPNIGHTIPWSYEGYSDEVKQCLERGNACNMRDKISKQRVFINISATLRIQPTMAFTVEPQIASSKAPLCSYHIIVAFSKGRKSISPSFESLFKAFAMDAYMHGALARLADPVRHVCSDAGAHQ
jgi:hypothetical protein